MKRNSIPLLAGLLFASACTMAVPGTDPAPPPPARSVPVPPRAAGSERAAELAIAREVITEGNRARLRNDLGALTANEGANRAAQDYADEIAIRKELDHTSRTPGRENVGARLTVAGVKWSRVGENLALISPRIGVAATTIEMWLNSPGHRRNLLNPAYTITGTGVSRDASGTYYVVQVYATP